MSDPEIVQTKLQKVLAVIAKVAFWIWIGTMLFFAGMVIYLQKPEHMLALPNWVGLGDIGLGVVAFIVAAVTHLISRPRPKKDTEALFKTLGLGIAGLALLIVLGRLPTNSSSGSVNGAKLFASPLPPITTNATFKPTPTPKAKVTTTQPKSQKITCVGPDYKEFQATAEECAKFRTDWGLSASATPWPTPKPQTTTNNQTTTTNNYSYDYNKYPLCTIYYPALHYSETYQYFTKEMCDSSKKSAENPFTTPIPTSTATPMPTPQPTANNQEMCNSLAAEWQNNKEVFYEQNYNNYSSSAEAIVALVNMMQPYQNALNNLGCNRTLSPY